MDVLGILCFVVVTNNLSQMHVDVIFYVLEKEYCNKMHMQGITKPLMTS